MKEGDKSLMSCWKTSIAPYLNLNKTAAHLENWLNSHIYNVFIRQSQGKERVGVINSIHMEH